MKKIIIVVIALFICGFAFSQEGAILYFDLDPDSTRTFRNYSPLDPAIFLNVDRVGPTEWEFRSWWEYGQSISLLIRPHTYDQGDTTYHFYQKLRLVQSQIGDTLTNCEWGTWPEFSYWELGDYPNQYFGLRYLVESGYCYGWIHLSVKLYEPAPVIGASRIDLAIHEMAYCTVPNYPLRAGQTSFDWDPTEENTMVRVIVQPNPTTDKITVQGENLRLVEVYDVQGQKVATTQASGNSVSIDLCGQPAGIYLISITNEEGKRCVKKVIKE